MKTDELKTGFWGYKKFSVYQYINTLEEQFSAQLLEKDRESREALEQEQQRVRQLEQELEDLRRQMEEQQREQMLARYDERLSRLRGQFVSMLREMEDSASELSAAVEEAKASAPAGNMSLFQRRPECETQNQRAQA